MPTQKLCIHFAYKNCTRRTQLMYTKCIQHVFHISTNSCIHFTYIQKNYVKRTMAAILYTKCIQKFVEMWDAFHIHFTYTLYTSILIYKSVKIMYTICIQNSYRICIQIIAYKMDLTFQHTFPICYALPS